MALTQDEAIIVGCIVAITVILIFGLVLWYFSYKSKLEKQRDYDKLDHSPIKSDMQQSTTQTLTEQQNLLTHNINHTDNANIVYYQQEEENTDSIEQNPTQKINNTGIVLVNSEYKLEVAQAQNVETLPTIPTIQTTNSSDKSYQNSKQNNAYENVANVTENNNATFIECEQQKTDIIEAENDNIIVDCELNENVASERTDNMNDHDFEVNVKEKKKDILDGGVQDRSETGVGRQDSMMKLKHAKVVKGKRKKFEKMIKQHNSQPVAPMEHVQKVFSAETKNNVQIGVTCMDKMEQNDVDVEMQNNVQCGVTYSEKMEQKDMEIVDEETKQYEDNFVENVSEENDEYKKQLNGNDFGKYSFGMVGDRDVVGVVDNRSKMKMNSLLLSTTRSTKLVIGVDSGVDVLAELNEAEDD